MFRLFQLVCVSSSRVYFMLCSLWTNLGEIKQIIESILNTDWRNTRYLISMSFPSFAFWPFCKLQQKKSCQKCTRPRIFSTYFLEKSFEFAIQQLPSLWKNSWQAAEGEGPLQSHWVPLPYRSPNHHQADFNNVEVQPKLRSLTKVPGNVGECCSLYLRTSTSTQYQTVGLGESLIQTHPNSQRLRLFLFSFPFLYVHYYPSFRVPVSLFGPFLPLHHLLQSNREWRLM